MNFRLLTIAITALTVYSSLSAQQNNLLQLWQDYDPNKGDFREEIIKDVETGGNRLRDSYISAYVLGEEIRVYCRYSVKKGTKDKKAPGLLRSHGWMSTAHMPWDFVNEG